MFEEERLSGINKKLHICAIYILNATYMSHIAASFIFESGHKFFNYRVIYNDEGFGTVFAKLRLTVLWRSALNVPRVHSVKFTLQRTAFNCRYS